MYINDTTKEIKSFSQLKADNPSISFPRNKQPVLLDIWFFINKTPKPVASNALNQVVKDTPVKENGVYVETYKEVSMFSDYTDEEGVVVTQATQEAEYLAILLQEAKDAKLSEMKEKRDELVNSTTEVTTSLANTFIVDVNIRNRSTMHQAVTNSANAGLTDADTVNWKMGDNTYQVVTYGELKEIGIHLGVFINAQFQHEAVKIAEINACTNIDCINAVTW